MAHNSQAKPSIESAGGDSMRVIPSQLSIYESPYPSKSNASSSSKVEQSRLHAPSWFSSRFTPFHVSFREKWNAVRKAVSPYTPSLGRSGAGSAFVSRPSEADGWKRSLFDSTAVLLVAAVPASIARWRGRSLLKQSLYFALGAGASSTVLYPREAAQVAKSAGSSTLSGCSQLGQSALDMYRNYSTTCKPVAEGKVDEELDSERKAARDASMPPHVDPEKPNPYNDRED